MTSLVSFVLLPVLMNAVVASDSSAIPKGVTDSDWKQIKTEYERHRHAAVPEGESALKARNFGQQMTARFDGRGFIVQPDSGTWTWGLELQRYGFVGHERPAPRTKPPVANGNRIALERGPLEEWWVNDTRGLEHGFTLRKRPTGSGGQLIFDLGVRGGLRAVVAADGQSVSFVGAVGAAVVN